MLPTRNGLGPSVVGLPPGPWACVLDFLTHRFPAIAPDEWAARMARGDVVDEAGQPVAPTDAHRPHTRLFYYRSLADEAANPAQEAVLFEDELLLVADKPHYLPVIPSGRYVHETLLVRLRHKSGLDDLAPLHRLDRETAGVVLFAKQPATVHHYAALFAQRGMHKTYEAIAPWREGMQFPLERRTGLVDGSHFMQMREWTAEDGLPGPPPAHTTVEWLETQGALARYRLTPHTGRRHQLRVHMYALGLPILGDQIYPNLQAEPLDDATNPLRLLAQSIAFIDPVTHQPRHFISQQALHFPPSH